MRNLSESRTGGLATALEHALLHRERLQRPVRIYFYPDRQKYSVLDAKASEESRARGIHLVTLTDLSLDALDEAYRQDFDALYDYAAMVLEAGRLIP